jgi:hypothetical protein
LTRQKTAERQNGYYMSHDPIIIAPDETVRLTEASFHRFIPDE